MLLLLQGDLIPWSQITSFGPTVVILVIVAVFLIRIAPVWKEVKMKELEIRADESDGRRELATAQTQLAEALKSIAVEQRRATENVQLLQRVNSDSTDKLSDTVDKLAERVRAQEDGCGECRGIVSRVQKLEVLSFNDATPRDKAKS